MRVLYLSGGFPYPLTSGYLRQYHLIRELSAAHRVTLLSLVGPRFTPSHVDALLPFTERVETLPVTGGSSLPEKVARHVRASVFGEPAVRRMATTARKLAASRPFDVVVTGKRTVGAIRHLNGTPVVADLCDASSSRIRRSMAFSGPARLPLLWLQYARVRNNERALARRADRAVFISARDLEDLGAENHERPIVVPNGVDLRYWQRTSGERGRDEIVFTGAMDYRPNTDAALHLVRDVLPRVRERVPSARLSLVGRDPPDLLRRAGAEADVVVTGFVDDVRPYLEKAAVFAAPIRFGAGMQNKILEAMAMEVPVVTTSLGADGLRSADGAVPPLTVADDAPALASAIVRILEATVDDPNPHADGRAFIQAHYTWEASGRRLCRILDEVTAA